MSDANIPQLPLGELFQRLQKEGLPLGIDEYQQMLHALQEGFGLQDLPALNRLCRALWASSREEQRLLDYYFAQIFTPLPLPTHTPQELSPVKGGHGRGVMHLMEHGLTAHAGKSTEGTAPTDEDYEKLRVQPVQAIAPALPIRTRSVLPYISPEMYFPVTRRQMKQSWRYLRRPIREGAPVELDIEATVHDMARTGVLLQPVLVPPRTNRARLFLLIDHGGSMVPFHLFAQLLVETATRSGRLEQVARYYFHNCPTRYLYRDMGHRQHELLAEMLDGRYSQWTGILVFSDAGAARGWRNGERVKQTEAFLRQFYRRFRYIAWLNPMPRERWAGTSAEYIRHSVPMFELSRRGLDDAIGVLRGRFSRDSYLMREDIE